MRAINRFVNNLRRALHWARVGWGLQGFDFGDILTVLEESIRPIMEHINSHRIHEGWDRDVRNMRVALDLLKRAKEGGMGDFYWEVQKLSGVKAIKKAKADQNYLFDLIKREIDRWWC